MAKMIGRRAWEHQKDDDDPIPKASIRNREDRQWHKDAEAELDNEYVFSRPMAGYEYDSTRVRNDDA